MGDIHGEYALMKELLKKWKPEEERLIILGDLADRGANSKETLEYAYHLIQTDDVVIVKGNHDEMLEKYLENPNEHYPLYYLNGGETTIKSLLGKKKIDKNPEVNAQNIKSNYPWLLSFLKSLDYFYEWKDYLFVHAGVDLSLEDWKQSTQRDFLWIREGFYNLKNHTTKTIVFGHTVTANLHGDSNNFNIWRSEDGLIGIDGGAVYGGKMHGLIFSDEGIEKQYSLQKEM